MNSSEEPSNEQALRGTQESVAEAQSSYLTWYLIAVAVGLGLSAVLIANAAK